MDPVAPSAVFCVLLDTLLDVARLADEVSGIARSDHHAALFYAAEQQNKYRWILNWSRAAWPSARSAWPATSCSAQHAASTRSRRRS